MRACTVFVNVCVERKGEREGGPVEKEEKSSKSENMAPDHLSLPPALTH